MRALEFVLIVLMLATASGCGLVAGVFLGFSAVMRAIARLPMSQGISALQSISVVVLLNRGLMSVFTVTAAFCAAALVWAIVRGQSMQAALAIGGGLLYLIGTYFVTMFVLVPRNDELLLLDPNDPVAAGPWRRFLRRWLAWNYVRTAAASAATLSFVLTLASE
jgi:uncharacterized membrane protein